MKKIIKMILVLLIFFLVIVFTYSFIKSGCKIKEDCFLCYKYKGFKNKLFTEDKFNDIKVGKKYNSILCNIGLPFFSDELSYTKGGEAVSFSLIYTDDFEYNYYILSFNKDSILVYKEIQEQD